MFIAKTSPCHAVVPRDVRFKCSGGLAFSRDRPQEFVLFDLTETLRCGQPTVDSEPATRVAVVSQIEPAETRQGHPGLSYDKVILGTSAPSAKSGTEIKSLATPLSEGLNRVVEWTWVARSQFKQTSTLPGKPALGPAVDLLSQCQGN